MGHQQFLFLFLGWRHSLEFFPENLNEFPGRNPPELREAPRGKSLHGSDLLQVLVAHDTHVLHAVPPLHKPVTRLAEQWEAEVTHLALGFREC